MQVEVKVLLNDVNSYDRVQTSLNEGLLTTDFQENYFVDGPNRELRNSGAVLRIRSINDGAKFTLALKEHGSVDEGSQVRWSKEEPLDAADAKAALEEPSSLLGLNSHPVIVALAGSFSGLERLQAVGHFGTKRMTYEWRGAKSQSDLTVRLDRTTYLQGASERFEVEVPGITVPTQDVIDELCDVLDGLEAKYSMGHVSKFEHFAQLLDAELSNPHMVQEAKLTLAAAEDVNKVRASLEGGLLSCDEQFNVYFDTTDGTISKRNGQFRLRFVGDTCRAIIKENSGVSEGSALCWAREENLALNVGEAMRDGNPNAIFAAGGPIAAALEEKYQIKSLTKLGGFHNRRETYTWKGARSQAGLTVRLDVTSFPFGERYELEVPGIEVPVHDVLDELSEVLTSLDASFEVAEKSKFQQFMTGLDSRFRSHSS